MRLPTRRTLAGIAALAAVIPMFGSQAAHADRCEPSELVIRPVFGQTYEEPMNEADNPGCYVLLNYVYPRLCDDQSTLLPSQTRPGCVRTINPDLNEPIVVVAYAPDGRRITCNLANFALFIAGQSPAC